MVFLKRRRVLAAKAETTPGTAEALTASEAAFNVFDSEYTADITADEREGQSALSKLPSVPGARSGSISFAVDLVGDGSGGIPAWATTFLPPCDMLAAGQVYKPSTGATDTISLAIYQDGLLKKLAGAKGTFNLDLNAGQSGRVNFTFTGKYAAPTDVTILAPTYPTTVPPRFASATLTIGTYVPKIATLTVDMNNEVIMREDSTDVTGFIAAHITNRGVNGTIDPEAELIATYDMYGNFIAGTEAALQAVIGALNNRVTIDVPKMQIMAPRDEDRNGVLIHAFDWQANRNAAAGDDEISFTFA